MAALFDQYPNPLLDLREVTAAYLEPLLYEETEEWRTELDWDYRPSADLVRRFVDMRALTGFALPGEKEAAGYGYYVCEDGKGLIGGLYLGRRYRTLEHENTLLTAILDAMWRTPGMPLAQISTLNPGGSLRFASGMSESGVTVFFAAWGASVDCACASRQ